MKLYTIGHSNHSIQKFTRLLSENGITLLVDVRTSPYSRFNPQYNRETVQKALTDAGFTYVFAGEYLGGRPSDPTCYKRGTVPTDDGTDYLHEVNYPEVMTRDFFQKGIRRLLELAAEQTAAIMCSEEDPATCHRHHLITKHLLDAHPDLEIWHIRGDGVTFRAQSLTTSVDTPDSQQLSLF